MTQKGIPEVLVPAGDMERLEAALRYGADAVYLGGKQHSMRSAPKNFTLEELAAGCKKAHAQGVRVYCTVNTLLKNEEVEALPAYLHDLADCGVDAVILADMGVLMLCRREVPELEVHISTQAGVTNYLTARELYKLGAKRVVLARELSLEEIRGIRQNTPPELELEYFVQGAMCVSFSGRCLLSNYFTGRDGNRGECAQPCRWRYHLVEETRPGQYFPISEEENGTYILNAKDLCLLPHLDKLRDAGVDSFKIEGRAKSAYYVAVAANAYRCAADLLKNEVYAPPQWLLEEPDKLSHRPYCTGFLFGRPEDSQQVPGGYIRTWEAAGVVEGWEKGRLLCSQRNKFQLGDTLEALLPGKPPVKIPVEDLRNGEGEPIQATPHATMAFSLPWEEPLPAGTILRFCSGKGIQP
ncbi:MAG: U32 family peptidase [Angelakisella sp.]|nr:U32 family peptidase [Angelakisella sp.]